MEARGLRKLQYHIILVPIDLLWRSLRYFESPRSFDQEVGRILSFCSGAQDHPSKQ